MFLAQEMIACSIFLGNLLFSFMVFFVSTFYRHVLFLPKLYKSFFFKECKVVEKLKKKNTH